MHTPATHTAAKGSDGEKPEKRSAEQTAADLVRIQQTWIQLQNDVNLLMDSSLAGKAYVDSYLPISFLCSGIDWSSNVCAY